MTYQSYRKLRAAIRAYDEVMRLVAEAQTPEEVQLAQREARRARGLWKRSIHGFRVWIGHPEGEGKARQ